MPRKQLKKKLTQKKSSVQKRSIKSRASSSRISASRTSINRISVGRKQKLSRTQNKGSKGISIIFFGLFLIILVIFFGYTFVLPSVILSDENTKNILIVSDNLDDSNKYISLAHLSKNHDENLIIFINGDETVEVGSNYGEYNLSSIYQLLKIDKQSDQKVKSIFSNILNVAIDEIVVTDGIDETNLENRELKKFFANNFISNINDSINNKINLLKLHFLVDSMEIFKYNSVSDLENVFYKLATLEEEIYKNCSVSVVNTTSITGLAQKLTNIIENTGAIVVQVEASDSIYEKTTIYQPTDKIDCQQFTNKILGIFPNEVEIKTTDELPLTEKFRSDVVIMVGEDY